MKQLIKDSLIKNSEKTAYINVDRKVTYRELYEKAVYMSELLRAQGTGPVVLYGHKEPAMIEGIISCIFAGRAYVPIDVSLPADRIRNIIAQCGATYVLNAGSSKCPTDESLSDDLGKYSGMPSKENDNDTAYIIFTSGSTGTPKGIPISYDNLKNFTQWIMGLDGLFSTCSEVVLNQANFNFDLSVADIFFSLTGGHTLLGVNSDDLTDLNNAFEIIEKENVSYMVITPSYLSMLLTNPEFDEIHFPKLKCIYLCGETLGNRKASKALERFKKLILINAYGPTEATSAVCAVTITREICEKYPNLPVGVIGNSATEVDISEGEIVLKGPSVFKGYLGGKCGGFSLEKDINTYRTGDAGFISEGYLFFNGRIDYQIKYKGYRIEPGEVENAVLEVPGVTECVVIPKTDSEGRVLFLKAFVSGNVRTETAIKDLLMLKLPGYMIPKTIKVIDKFPITENGKIDRKELANYD